MSEADPKVQTETASPRRRPSRAAEPARKRRPLAAAP